ncbi:hypothetical protein [Raineyella sp. W15-4]|uniref:hypothetical protein n=1 Tax=Raineyella sp. W15-4 TaxID=3081651 RepID=UPI002953C6BD|nr:hypothetical protein [Raineyella sp. W15-4]WOQ16717.1 hypothetical protein R0145_16150 [Raineyella sp. W15-4]
MADGLGGTADVLDRHCALVQGDLWRVLDQCERLLHDAVTQLGGFEDPAARRAVEAVNTAREQIQTVRYGWLNDYVDKSHILIERIRSM